MNGLDPTYLTENNMFQLMVTSIKIFKLNQAIKFYKVYYFADDTIFLHFNISVAKLNKLVNQDMKN